jgi:hypothetical protein
MATWEVEAMHFFVFLLNIPYIYPIFILYSYIFLVKSGPGGQLSGIEKYCSPLVAYGESIFEELL